jgi:hypothetical protein
MKPIARLSLFTAGAVSATQAAAHVSTIEHTHSSDATGVAIAGVFMVTLLAVVLIRRTAKART